MNCDSCLKDFSIKLKTKKLKSGTDEIYFTCDNCNKKYTSYFSNKKIKKLQNKIRMLTVRITNAKDQIIKKELIAERTIIRDATKAEIDRLRYLHGKR